MSSAFSQFDAIFNILIIVTIITLAARRFRFPSTIALIFAGLASTFTTRFPLPNLGARARLRMPPATLCPGVIRRWAIRPDTCKRFITSVVR